ncbi:noncanonical pyrimidine nucleotidase, YjjG family [Enterococcus sp. JM4C]|uniref:YjjG family noncanonical pyrimidine nucleotidase n=1 Tax=Candidatus Enterococcus huntleyi TaxID=1857217 RepID=UPI00137B0226|nr:YjjG family noncanonical pyrimidine nucleotidase [Enterococcus sp. JM4C]KAF1299477.1 noncanonical pyrimidine nucleotidase, YjjG family [Enterococcus sp. JM4C]
MNYSTLLFDVDDTLLDFQLTEEKALTALFKQQGIELTADLKASYKALNHQLWREFEEGKRTRDQVIYERFSLFFQQFGQAVDGVALEQDYREYLNQGHDLLGNSREIIADLAEKADLYIVTNGVSKTQYQRLADSKMTGYFKDIFVSEDTGYQKPMKEYFDYVFARIEQFDPSKTVIIGDSLTSDIKGGQLSGIDQIWLQPEGVKEDPLIQPTFKIQKLEEIYSILEK